MPVPKNGFEKRKQHKTYKRNTRRKMNLIVHKNFFISLADGACMFPIAHVKRIRIFVEAGAEINFVET